jgi:hypothetical protein
MKIVLDLCKLLNIKHLRGAPRNPLGISHLRGESKLSNVFAIQCGA